eukprot:scaffold38580_cov75-Phaeocystis_antarctica.AAC.3
MCRARTHQGSALGRRCYRSCARIRTAGAAELACFPAACTWTREGSDDTRRLLAHGVHASGLKRGCPRFGLKVPGSQAVGCSDLSEQNVPGPQTSQALSFVARSSGLYVPAGHAVSEADSSGQYVPARHGIGLTVPLPQ